MGPSLSDLATIPMVKGDASVIRARLAGHLRLDTVPEPPALSRLELPSGRIGSPTLCDTGL